jgi:hypothetical protein
VTPGRKGGVQKAVGKAGKRRFGSFFFFTGRFFLRRQSSGYTVHEEGGDVVHLKRQLKLMAVL